jgi:hypothetical protein
MFLRLIGLAFFIVAEAAAAQNILFNSNHAATSYCAGVANGGSLPSGMYVDATQASNATTTQTLVPVPFYSYATNGSNTYYVAATTTPENQQPYKIESTSFGGYSYAMDVAGFPLMFSYNGSTVTQNLLHNMAFLAGYSPMPAGTPPPNGMMVTSRCNATADAGPGDELCMTDDGNGWYPGLDPGCDTSSPSGSTASLSQMAALLQNYHSGFSLGDVHAILRQTAANWPTYNASTFGFGAVNWTAAKAISSTSSIYLQPPNLSVVIYHGNYGTFTFYPMYTARYSYNVVGTVSSPLPTGKNELTSTDLSNAGWTQLCSTQNVSGITPVCSYTAAVPSTLTVYALSTDGSGNYSAPQSYSSKSVILTASTQCQ